MAGATGRRRGAAGPGWGPWDCPRPPDRGSGGVAPVVVHQQRDGGGRQVSAGEMMGAAQRLVEVLALVRRIGVHLEHEEARTARLIQWRGGGADAWQ